MSKRGHNLTEPGNIEIGLKRLKMDVFPCVDNYSYSHTHNDKVTYIVANTEYIFTSSLKSVRVWAKEEPLTMVKELSITGTNNLLLSDSFVCAIGDDAFFIDLHTLDVIHIVKDVGTVCLVGDNIAVSKENKVRFYDSHFELKETVATDHKGEILYMVYSHVYKRMISIDGMNFIEIWDTPFEAGDVLSFELKSKTDLYHYKKTKRHPVSLTVYEKWFIIYDKEGYVTMFHIYSGKIFKQFDESLETLRDEAHDKKLFTLRAKQDMLMANKRNVLICRDHLIYATTLGIKIVDHKTNTKHLVGTEETIPFNVVAFSATKKANISAEALTADNDILKKKLLGNNVLVATSHSNRFYTFMQNQSTTSAVRDLNDDVMTKQKPKNINITLHTTLGDIQLMLYPQYAPKTVANFVNLCKSHYYDNLTFHRVIKRFMIQTGDPNGDGAGGEAYGGRFIDDEFSPMLTHDKPYMVSMANPGTANSNGSQFFINTVPASWLNNKHSVFGSVSGGIEVVQALEDLQVDRNDKPVTTHRIVSVSVT